MPHKTKNSGNNKSAARPLYSLQCTYINDDGFYGTVWYLFYCCRFRFQFFFCQWIRCHIISIENVVLFKKVNFFFSSFQFPFYAEQSLINKSRKLFKLIVCLWHLLLYNCITANPPKTKWMTQQQQQRRRTGQSFSRFENSGAVTLLIWSNERCSVKCIHFTAIYFPTFSFHENREHLTAIYFPTAAIPRYH